MYVTYDTDVYQTISVIFIYSSCRYYLVDIWFGCAVVLPDMNGESNKFRGAYHEMLRIQ